MITIVACLVLGLTSISFAENPSQNPSLLTYCGGKDREAQVKGPYVWQPYSRDAQGQHDWADENIKKNHGPLGALYPDRFGRKGGLEGGGTTSWIGLVNKGLYCPEHITWGGWAGRFTAEKKLNVPAKYQSFLAHYQRQSHQGHSNLVLAAMDNLLNLNRKLKVETSPLVEATHRLDKHDKFEWVALYNHSGQRDNALHRPIPIHNIMINLQQAKSVKAVRLLKNIKQLGFSTAGNGSVLVTVPVLKHYEIVLFEYE